MQAIEKRLAATLRKADCEGCLHVVDIDTGAAVGLQPRQLAVAASVFKVAVALELFRQHEQGVLELTEQVRLEAAQRTAGPTGLSNALDPVTMSLRDLASLMLSISDNAATDALIARVGLDNVRATVQALGLDDTVIVSDLRGMLDSIASDAGVENLSALGALSDEERDARLNLCRALIPETATRTTPYDMTLLLREIWRDEAADDSACAHVRRLMGQQTSHRIAVGFPNEVRVQAKSGSLMGKVRNEIGVVTYPDGRRYAVAVFTTAKKRLARQPAIDAAIGVVAAMAVGELAKDEG